MKYYLLTLFALLIILPVLLSNFAIAADDCSVYADKKCYSTYESCPDDLIKTDTCEIPHFPPGRCCKEKNTTDPKSGSDCSGYVDTNCYHKNALCPSGTYPTNIDSCERSGAFNANGHCCTITDPGPKTEPPTESNYDYTPLEPLFEGDKDGGFVHYIQMIYKFLIWTVGIAALLMLSIGGFMYVTSAGNKANAETAKKIIKDSLLGLIIVLVAWVILYLINPDLIKINLESIQKLEVTLPNPPAGAGPGAPRAVPIDPKNPPTNLPKGCENYKQAFHDAADGDSELECLLYAVASAESRCDPNADSGLACGIMQFKPSTAQKSCTWLKENPDESIAMAAAYLGQNQSYLNSHYDEFSIGGSSAQSSETVTVGSYTYNAGNDDLIASYNAGPGRGPFTPSVDCAPSDPRAKQIPAWQCDKGNVFADGQTIDYVQRVQAFQNMCSPM